MNTTGLYTYQDLLSVGEEEANRITFCKAAINKYQQCEDYKIALDAKEYAEWRNPTIMRYQKVLYTITGRAVPDNYTANHKCASNFFNRFITQQNQYLLGNGVTFDEDGTKEKLGADFDTKLQEAGKWALIQAVSYGFWNFDHLEIFKMTEFCPLFDEEDGSLKAGIRWWRINPSKPLRMILYELDGYTQYRIDTNKAGQESASMIGGGKKTYKQIVKANGIDGVRVYNFENYPGFPIVPLWGNSYKQSSLVGVRNQIDAYDLIKSGFANDLDDCSMIYWTLENAGGMGDVDLAKFIERMKTVKAAVVDGDDGAKATAHTIDVPYQSRETYLTRLEKDMYKDFMALDVEQVASSANTATQIKAAYEPLNNKTDEYEYCVISFIQGVLFLAGVNGSPKFKRSMIANQTEETQMVLMAANYLDDETVLNKLPWLDADEAAEVIKRRDEAGMGQFSGEPEEPDDTDPNAGQGNE